MKRLIQFAYCMLPFVAPHVDQRIVALFNVNE